jgi:hypothetical protein
MILKAYLYVKYRGKQFTIPFFSLLFRLDLSIGPIPPEIVKLVILEQLVLQKNQLTGLLFSQFLPNNISQIRQW